MTDTEAKPAAFDLTRPGWSMQMFIDQAYATDPRPFFDSLRSAGGAARDEIGEGDEKRTSIIVSRYSDVQATLRNPKTFSSEFGAGVGGLGNDRPMIPLQIDPPEHKKYRKLLDPFLEPRKVARLEAEVERLVNELIDKFIDTGRCEFLQDFAVPLPCTVFLRLLGLPLEDLDLFLEIKEGIIRGNNETTLQAQFEARSAAGKRCYEYFETALDKIAEDRIEGLLLDLMEAEIEGERLTRDEIMDVCYLFIIAGLDTVTDSLCCFWTHLIDYPENRRMIVEDPSLIPNAIEELLRWESPVSGVARVATEHTEIDGCPVHPGDNLFVLVGSANTDPNGIDGADEVDFHRETNRHFAFGSGIHRCLGSHLARLELRVAMREWHRRIPDYHVPAGTQLLWTPMLRAVLELPLELTAAP